MPDKKYFMAFILSLLGFTSRSQTSSLNNENRIFVTERDLHDTIGHSKISRIEEPWGRLGSYIVAIDEDGKKIRYRKTSIWGYKKNRENHIRRVVGHDSYKIIEMSDIVVYKMCVRHGAYYFSTSLNGKIFLLNRKELLKEVGDDQFAKLCRTSHLVKQIVNYGYAM